MRLAPLLILSLINVGQTAVLAQEANHSPLTRHVRSVLSILESQEQTEQPRPAPSHPLVIRIHEKAFANSAGNRIDTTRPVSTIILGTPVSGRSRTQGAVQVDTSSARQSADFLVSFSGRSFSRTVGVNGPARIHSHTVTDFVVSRKVTFSPLRGFESKQTVLQTRTCMTLDNVCSTRGGLRGALVRRVGWRRASESRQAAERIADGNVRRELRQSFDRQLDERVADLNRRFRVALYARAVLGGSEELDIKVSSTDDCVQFAIGRVGNGAPPTLPVRQTSAPVEVWVHDSPLEHGETDRIKKAWTLLAAGAKTVTALETLSLVAGNAKTPNGLEINTEGGWTILSFDPAATNGNRPEVRLARRSAN